MMIDDIHKIEIVIGIVSSVLLLLLFIGTKIYFKVIDYKLKKDLEKKRKEEDKNDS